MDTSADLMVLTLVLTSCPPGFIFMPPGTDFISPISGLKSPGDHPCAPEIGLIPSAHKTVIGHISRLPGVHSVAS